MPETTSFVSFVIIVILLFIVFVAIIAKCAGCSDSTSPTPNSGEKFCGICRVRRDREISPLFTPIDDDIELAEQEPPIPPQIENLSVSELRRQLISRGLPPNGLRRDLIRRLAFAPSWIVGDIQSNPVSPASFHIIILNHKNSKISHSLLLLFT